MYKLRSKSAHVWIVMLVIIATLFVNIKPVSAYTIRSITFEWLTVNDGTIAMRFDATANYHWVTSGRLSPLPEENYDAWKFGAINGVNVRYMVVGAVMGEEYRICLGASDGDPGSEAGLYHHPNNRCFKVWRTGASTLGWVELFNVYGRTTNSIGASISGVTISNGAGRSTVTNNNGEYALLNLTSGSHILTASKSNYTFTPGSRTVSGGPPFHITEQNFTGATTYSVTGRIADALGNPAAEVVVENNIGHSIP